MKNPSAITSEYSKGNATRLPAWVALARAREHLADVEQRHFSGAAHQDELRAAYVALQQAERAVVEARV